eukprot:1477054-Pleurochrysis_carterae.AAC.1
MAEAGDMPVQARLSVMCTPCRKCKQSESRLPLEQAPSCEKISHCSLCSYAELLAKAELPFSKA